jgi:hypothetical protein
VTTHLWQSLLLVTLPNSPGCSLGDQHP